MPQVRFLSDGMPQHGLLSFTVAGHTAAEVKAYLMAQGMEVAANQAAFTPLDMHARHLDAVVRVSAHASTGAWPVEAITLFLIANNDHLAMTQPRFCLDFQPPSTLVPLRARCGGGCRYRRFKCDRLLVLELQSRLAGNAPVEHPVLLEGTGQCRG